MPDLSDYHGQAPAPENPSAYPMQQERRDDGLLSVVVTAAALVARADGRLHRREEQMLQLIRITLDSRLIPA